MKCIIITGAAGGIGAALAGRFAKAGYRVIGIDIADMQQGNGNFYAVHADLAQYAIDQTYRANINGLVRSACSDSQLCALINNAAVQRLGPFDQLDATDWKQSMDVNILAPVALIREFLPELSRTRGSVINIASIHARLTKPGFSAYATSKAALLGLTSALAVELGGHIQVMAICPAAIATPMLLAGFEGRPDEFAQLAQFHPSGNIGSADQLADLALSMVEAATPFYNGMVVNFDGGISGRLHDPA